MANSKLKWSFYLLFLSLWLQFALEANGHEDFFLSLCLDATISANGKFISYDVLKPFNTTAGNFAKGTKLIPPFRLFMSDTPNKFHIRTSLAFPEAKYMTAEQPFSNPISSYGIGEESDRILMLNYAGTAIAPFLRGKQAQAFWEINNYLTYKIGQGAHLYSVGNSYMSFVSDYRKYRRGDGTSYSTGAKPFEYAIEAFDSGFQVNETLEEFTSNVYSDETFKFINHFENPLTTQTSLCSGKELVVGDFLIGGILPFRTLYERKSSRYFEFRNKHLEIISEKHSMDCAYHIIPKNFNQTLKQTNQRETKTLSYQACNGFEYDVPLCTTFNITYISIIRAVEFLTDEILIK